MELTNIIILIISLLLGIVGYFLKGAMNDIKETKKMTTELRSEVDILKTDYHINYDNLNDKVDDLKKSVADLVNEIKDLNKNIHK